MSAWEASAGASDEWYTPAYIFDALGVRFDLDVAHPPTGTSCPHADNLFAGGSLESPWSGFVWMNPPFGARNGLTPWLDKFFAHGDGVALTPDRTSAPWFQESWPRADAVLFVREKIKFIRPGGSVGKQPGTGTTLWACGSRGVKALERAASPGFGILAIPSAALTLKENDCG